MSDIENNVDLPKEPAKRTRARAVKDKVNPFNVLLKGLKLVSQVQKKVGEDFLQYCYIVNNWVAASNQVVTIATPIDHYDTACCPHTFQLIAALEQCGEKSSLVQLDNSVVIVPDEKTKLMAPALTAGSISIPDPDPCIAQVTNALKTAFAAVLMLADENNKRTFCQGVLLQANTVVATNGSALLEAWHGVDLPPNLIVPKQFAQIIAKLDKDLTGFGFSSESVTLYCADGTFIKTLIYKDTYPNYLPLLEMPQTLKPEKVTKEFLQAVETIEKFTNNNRFVINNGKIATDFKEDLASVCTVKNSKVEMIVSIPLFKQVKHAFENVAYTEDGTKAFIFANGVRGVLMGCDKGKAYVAPAAGQVDETDDIPF